MTNTQHHLHWPKAASVAIVSVFLISACPYAMAQPAQNCGNPREMGFEKDYRTATPKARHLVESFHFTPEVEALLRGKSGSLNQDIAYTLRHFPNHHRALVAVMRLGDRYKAERIPDVPYSIDCYFRRATQLAPDDSIARMLYASYLFRKDRTVEANLQVDRAMELAAENGLTHYNIGLVLLEHRQLERALQQAHRALALGYPRTDLKERLITSGRWRDPEPPAAAASRPEAKQD